MPNFKDSQAVATDSRDYLGQRRSNRPLRAYHFLMDLITHRRRLVLFGAVLAAAAVTGLLLAGPLKAALPHARQIAFEVFRDGEPLGHHKVFFRDEGGDLHVEIDIRLEVKLAFFTLFRYRHTNREVWRDGRLLAIDTQTDDDGEGFWLRGRAAEAGLQVEGSSGSFLAPADIMPTSYWNPLTVESTRMLDTQRGRLIDVDIEPAGVETMTLAGKPVRAERFKVTGDLVLDLWYTSQGEWAKTSFVARGAEVVYARRDGTASMPDMRGVAQGQ